MLRIMDGYLLVVPGALDVLHSRGHGLGGTPAVVPRSGFGVAGGREDLFSLAAEFFFTGPGRGGSDDQAAGKGPRGKGAG